MKKIILAALVALQTTSYGQTPDELFRSLVDAENSFAARSAAEGTKTAFLAYLTDSTVLFEKGKPIKGKGSWQNRPAGNSLLFWWPVFAGISADGNMGFSSGPWQWSANRDSAQPAAQGYYATVWQKTGDGWKLAADIGISLPDTALDRTGVYNASGP
ncbi:MAG: nuclear transport factor 2 family protein, partial [Chitinophagaceae bacterium]